MFQNTGTAPFRTPVRPLRYADEGTYWPSGTNGTLSSARLDLCVQFLAVGILCSVHPASRTGHPCRCRGGSWQTPDHAIQPPSRRTKLRGTRLAACPRLVGG